MPYESRNTKTITSPSTFATSNQSISGISKTAVPPLQKAPAEEQSEERIAQMYNEHAGKVNSFPLPDGNKSAGDEKAGITPFQLKESNKGEAADAAPEAWHVVQRQQGRVQAAVQLKKGDGAKGNTSEKPVQRMVKYEFDPGTNKFFNVKYIRGNQPLSLIGKMHGKHTTADASQAAVYELGLEGRTLEDGLHYLTEVTKAYLNMPGNYLMEFHMNNTGNIAYNSRNEGIPLAFHTYFELHKKLYLYSLQAGNLVLQYKGADDTGKQMLAFQMLAMVNNITYNLGEFRDVVPLVSLYSKGEKGGKEKEAKASLYETERLLRGGGTIDEETKAELKLELMDHFDLAAIKMIYDTSEEADKEEAYALNLRTALNWLDIDLLASKVVDMDSGKIADKKVFERIAGELVTNMIHNHIVQMYVSYPEVAKAVNFQDFSITDITALMEKKNFSPLNDEVAQIYEEGIVDMWEEEDDAEVEEETEGKGKEKYDGEGEPDETEDAVGVDIESDYDYDYDEGLDGENALDEEIKGLNEEITTDNFIPASTKEERKNTTYHF